MASLWYHFRKQFSVWVFPIMGFGAIFLDWNHTREWKAAGKYSSLCAEVLGDGYKAPSGTTQHNQQQQASK
ncbi:hypothetical protein WR25_01188 [Diploscapter pachys]|uniref:Complex I-MNLL n=1 Tax=Diploscapter pachys TaxID=2018661 RepID=A0A2A2K1Z1_9BILA|nr:hypothetical protein WR25_01188 [Diploscapter pachys]